MSHSTTLLLWAGFHAKASAMVFDLQQFVMLATG